MPLNGAQPAEILALAASLESRSEHPIGRAIVERALADGVAADQRRPRRSAPGPRRAGTVAARTVVVGSHRLVERARLVRTERRARDTGPGWPRAKHRRGRRRWRGDRRHRRGRRESREGARDTVEMLRRARDRARGAADRRSRAGGACARRQRGDLRLPVGAAAGAETRRRRGAAGALRRPGDGGGWHQRRAGARRRRRRHCDGRRRHATPRSKPPTLR